MEVAQHYGTGGECSDPESSNDYTEIPKKTQQQQQQQQQQPNNNNLAHIAVSTAQTDFAVAAAAAAAAMNSEDFRSHSIAALRARAEQHTAALIHHPDWNPAGGGGGGGLQAGKTNNI